MNTRVIILALFEKTKMEVMTISIHIRLAKKNHASSIKYSILK